VVHLKVEVTGTIRRPTPPRAQSCLKHGLLGSGRSSDRWRPRLSARWLGA